MKEEQTDSVQKLYSLNLSYCIRFGKRMQARSRGDASSEDMLSEDFRFSEFFAIIGQKEGRVHETQRVSMSSPT